MDSQFIRVMLVAVFLAAITSCGKPDSTSNTQDSSAGLKDNPGPIQRVQSVAHRNGRTIDIHGSLPVGWWKVDSVPYLIPFVAPPTDEFLTDAENEEKQRPWRDVVDNIFTTNFLMVTSAGIQAYDAENGRAFITTPLERPLKADGRLCTGLDGGGDYVITVGKDSNSALDGVRLTDEVQLAQIKDSAGLIAGDKPPGLRANRAYASVPIPSTVARQIDDAPSLPSEIATGKPEPYLNWYFSVHLDGPNSYTRARCDDHSRVDVIGGRKMWDVELRDFIGTTLNYAVLAIAWADGLEDSGEKNIVKREVIGVWMSPSYSDAYVRADLADQLSLAGETDQWESVPSWDELLPHAQRYSSDQNIDIGEYAKTPALTAILIGNLPDEVSEAWANAQLGDYKAFIPMERDTRERVAPRW